MKEGAMDVAKIKDAGFVRLKAHLHKGQCVVNKW